MINGKTPAEILADPGNTDCKCPEADCEWRGKCRECIALHRYGGTTPSCLGGNKR